MTELKLPEPDTHCLDDEGGRPIDVWSYSPELVRQIIEADRAQQSARHAEELLAYEVTVSNLREQAQPVATLHDDGYWTWKQGRPPHVSNYAGWRMDVYAAKATGPAWHDKPTVPGLWVVGSRCLHINELDLPIYERSNCRWYGPISDDVGGKP